jgi:hypothetical protein
VFAFVVAAMLGPAPVPEPDGALALTWRGAPGCDDGPRAQELLPRLTGPQATGRASVELAGAGETWTAQVTVVHAGETTHRTLFGPCRALTEAAVLVIAVTIDPLGTTRAVQESTRGPELELPADSLVAPSPPRVRTSPVVVPAADRPARLPALSFGLQIGGGGTIGLVPGLGGRIGGGAVLGLSRARLVLGALHEFSRRLDHPDEPSAGANVRLTAGHLAMCWSPRAGRVTFPVCGGVEAGAFVADGVGLQNRDRAVSPWLAVVPQAELLVWAPRWLGFGPAIALPIAVLRPRFSIDDFEPPLVRVGPAGLRFGLAVTFVLFDETRPTRARGGRRR